MKNTIGLFYFSLILLCCGNVATAQIKFAAKDSLSDKMKQAILETRSKFFNDPEFPRFVIVDKSGDYVFGVGGYVGAIPFYDGGGIDGRDFIPYDIITPNADKKLDRLGIDVSISRLNFKLVGNNKKVGRIIAYLEMDFRGSGNNVVRLRNAYVRFRGLLVGQYWSAISDTESPATIDMEGPPSSCSMRVPQIRYSFNLSKKLALTVSAEVPNVTVWHEGNVLELNERFPDIPVVLSYNGDKFNAYGGYVFRSLRYRDFDHEISRHIGTAVIFSANYTFWRKNTAYLQAIYVNGMANYMQDISGNGMDMVVNPVTNTLDIGEGGGFYVGYRRLWGKNDQSNIIWSQTFTDYSMNNGVESLYKKANYLAVNYIRSVFTYGKVGLEFLYGSRKNVNGDWGSNYRINLLIRYDF